MGSLLKESRLYQERKESLSPEDRKRLELQEQQIATGTEDYRAEEANGVRIHYFNYGLISFQPLERDLTLLIAFKLFDLL